MAHHLDRGHGDIRDVAACRGRLRGRQAGIAIQQFADPADQRARAAHHQVDRDVDARVHFADLALESHGPLVFLGGGGGVHRLQPILHGGMQLGLDQLVGQEEGRVGIGQHALVEIIGQRRLVRRDDVPGGNPFMGRIMRASVFPAQGQDFRRRLQVVSSRGWSTVDCSPPLRLKVALRGPGAEYVHDRARRASIGKTG